uniref:Uncharacterized protein n=1 Tax=Faecalibaculum rodentium TaxID=1702221 RepID=A0A140DYG8_9FIRM|nr:hypothetical protein AALO17_25610 [Faecalibaculum rodentium]
MQSQVASAEFPSPAPFCILPRRSACRKHAKARIPSLIQDTDPGFFLLCFLSSRKDAEKCYRWRYCSM